MKKSSLIKSIMKRRQTPFTSLTQGKGSVPFYVKVVFIIIASVAVFLSASTAEETTTITLKNGKNLISIPLIPQNDQIPSILESITGLYTDVWGFEPLDTVDPWKHYRPDLTEYSDLKKIKHGMGYYIFATGDTSLTVTGAHSIANYTFILDKGWNVIGWPYLYEESIESALTNNASPSIQFGIDYNQISRINPVTKEQEDYYNNPSLDIFNKFEPGKGYYIYFLGQNPVQVTLLLIPQVKITSHTDNSYVNTPLIDISGTIDDDTTIVEVNGVAAAVINKKFKAINVFLHAGSNTITATAANLVGNSSSDSITLYLDTQAPNIHITSPSNGAVINEAPITVTGTVDDPNAYIDVNGVFADITGDTFQAEGVDLRLGANTITATAYDTAGNVGTDQIIVASTVTSDYELIKLTEDIYPGSPQTPIAGSQIELKVKLIVEDVPLPNEPIQFNITSGGGSLSQQIINTGVNGIAINTLTLDTNSGAINQVEAYAVSYPAKKVTFGIYTKPGQAANLIKITDDTVRPVPGATIPLIVKVVDAHNNAIENEGINFTILSGGGTLAAASAVTNYYGEAEVNFTAPNAPQTLSQIRASSVTNPSLVAVFSITTSPGLTLTFDDIMTKVRNNENKILDLMADVVTTSNDPSSCPEKHFKLWVKGEKSKIQYLVPTQDIFIVITTPTSITINNEPLLTVTEEVDPNITEISTIESFSGDIYTLKTVLTSTEGFGETIKYYVDCSKGIIIKTEDEYRDSDKKEFTEISCAYVLINNIWVSSGTTVRRKDFNENQEYITTETRANIIINSGIPDTIFQ